MYKTDSDENFVVSLIFGEFWEAFFGYLFMCLLLFKNNIVLSNNSASYCVSLLLKVTLIIQLLVI